MLNILNQYPPPPRPLPEEMVIQIDHGGLGDHLFWLHVPEIAKNLGVKRVYLNAEKSAYRNPLYRTLWTQCMEAGWLDGFTDKPCTKVADYYPYNPGWNMLDLSMWNMGIDDDERWHSAVCYYRPRMRDEYAGLTVYDPNYISGVGNPMVRNIERYFMENDIRVDAMMQPRGAGIALALPVSRIIHTETWMEYADLIHSCKTFICMTSGGATLADAIGKSALCIHGPYQSPIYHHSRRNTYVCC